MIESQTLNFRRRQYGWLSLATAKLLLNMSYSVAVTYLLNWHDSFHIGLHFIMLLTTSHASAVSKHALVVLFMLAPYNRPIL